MSDQNHAAIAAWIVEQGLHGRPLDEVIVGFCHRLRISGHPISRANVSLRTLHPRFGAHTFVWEASDNRITRQAHSHQDGESEGFLQSPIHRLVNDPSRPLRCRLDGRPLEVSFPVVEELRERGYTDYAAALVSFAEQQDFRTMAGIFFSCATECPGGFTDHDLETITDLLPTLALALKSASVQEVAVNIVEAYLGSDAGHQVLRGKVQRGSVETIDAAILFADLRGFTETTAVLPREEILARLNSYFDCIVLPIEQNGGQVLKFLGDGLLATFALGEGRSLGELCHSALDAAKAALVSVDALNCGLAAKGEREMALDIALHLGEVMYGNIGAADRLDFTIIGKAVNEASRIEALCDQLDRNLLISDSFATALEDKDLGLVSLGPQQLRAVSKPREIFGIADTERAGKIA